jgi:hypothetical protein
MQVLNYSRSEDHPTLPAQQAEVHLEGLLGTWVNTSPSAPGVSKLIVFREQGKPHIRIFGSGSPRLVDWGKVPIETIYAKDVSSREPMAFDARYDLGFMDVQVQANFSLGLLVLACFNTFKDSSGRSSYFSREFFHREVEN